MVDTSRLGGWRQVATLVAGFGALVALLVLWDEFQPATKGHPDAGACEEEVVNPSWFSPSAEERAADATRWADCMKDSGWGCPDDSRCELRITQPGGGGSDRYEAENPFEVGPEQPTTTTRVPTTLEAAAPAEECEEASEALLSDIGAGLTFGETLASLSKGAVVRSDDFEKVWFIAAEVGGLGTGVWARNSIDNDASALTFSVNAVAREWSNWGGSTDAALEMSDHGAQEAVDCLSS